MALGRKITLNAELHPPRIIVEFFWSFIKPSCFSAVLPRQSMFMCCVPSDDAYVVDFTHFDTAILILFFSVHKFSMIVKVLQILRKLIYQDVNVNMYIYKLALVIEQFFLPHVIIQSPTYSGNSLIHAALSKKIVRLNIYHSAEESNVGLSSHCMEDDTVVHGCVQNKL